MIFPFLQISFKYYNIVKNENDLYQEVRKYESLIEFHKEQTGKDEYIKKMEAKVNSEELHKLYDSIRENYGLLGEIQFYGYSATSDSFDRIIEYIKMCDKVRGFSEKSKKSA